MIRALFFVALLVATVGAGATEPSQPPAVTAPWDPAARLAVQREAMKALDFLDGAWRGEAEAAEAPGRLTQTERVGSLLGGSVKLIEGRGYDEAGKTVFNAFAIVSYDPARKTYSMRSYAMGYAGDYPLALTEDGFSWSHPAGPGATIRYTATVRDGEWHEVGERIVEGRAPVKTLEMRLKRIGDGAWPAGGAVPPR